MKAYVKTILGNELFGGLIILLIFFLLLLTSCATSDDRTQALLLKQGSPLQATKTDALNEGLNSKAGESRKRVSSADYKVGPEDLLEIDVFQVPELKTSARVSAKGYIKLYLIDQIKVGGLTVAEIESLIIKGLEKYVNEPVVSVFVREYRSQQISVLGMVKSPQVYYVSGQKYLLDMLSLAGGLTPESGSVCIVQTMSGGSGQNGSAERIMIDLNELLVNGRSELNIPVYSGDVIQVPRSGIFFVTGAVASGGEFFIKGKGTTLTEAISMAKGFSYEASRSDLKIYRDTGKPEREVITVDYDAVLEGKSLDAELKDRDIIVIGSNGLKSFIKGFSGALNLGSFSVGKGL